MLFQSALLAGLVLSGYASATLNTVFQPSDDLEEVLRRDADMLASLTRRQDSNNVVRQVAPSSTPASGDASKADFAKWETETRAGCMNALNSLNGQASNPTGLAICYNLPFLDNTTGIFQAELRLYNVSAPIDPWNGVTAAQVSMTLSYLGATVQSMNGTFIKRDIAWPPVRARGLGSLVERQAASSAEPVELKILNYVGRINSNLMGSAMTQASLQPLLVPQIELAAKNPITNQDVIATLSSQEASFVNGVFANQAASPINPAAAAAASAQVDASAPFILPGVNLAFFPTGLVITSAWCFGFFVVVGSGTIGRIQFREQYRRRVKNEMARGVRTI